MESGEAPQSIRLGQVKEGTTGEGKIPVHFLWNAEPKEFGGFDQEGLTALSQQAADFFHIAPSAKEKIHVYFGDHTSITFPNGRTITRGNIAIPGFRMDGKGTVDDATVLINRSRELYDEQGGGEEDAPPRSDDIEISKYGFIGLQLRHPWEGVAWRVAEEINHAGVAHKLGTHEKIKDARAKFEERAKIHHRTMDYVFPYSTDLMEVTAARQILRFLKGLAEERDPERVPVYEDALQKSFETKFVVLPGYGQIKDATYINTGYQPQANK